MFAANSSRVQSDRGRSITSSTAPDSTIRPSCITNIRFAIDGNSAKSCVMNINAMPFSTLNRFNSSITCACTSTSSADVASSQIKSAGSNAIARAIAAR